MSELQIRPYLSADRSAVGEICVLTGRAGSDATGMYEPDTLLPDVFVWPYVERHAEFAFVLVLDGSVVGYTVAAPDTAAYAEWFRDTWWPAVAGRYQRGLFPAQDELIAYADGIGRVVEPDAAAYPAHLHIDLLPAAQGGGWGRRLIEHLCAALAAAGVPGVHLVASPENAGALAFYPRVGFTPSASTSAGFVRSLA